MAVIIAVVVTAAVVLILVTLAPEERRIEYRIGHCYGIHDPQFTQAMGVLLGPPLVPGNRVEPLQNGDEIFPAMLDAIRRAEQTICFETYIYWSGDIGREFAHALAERARHGVRVHVLLDWIGTGRLDPASLDLMRDAGVEIEKYHKPRWYNFARMNNRTHRKILVVDGRVGFTGGVGIADEWLGHAQDPEHWRDVHFRVEGPAVSQMQATFLDNWMQTRGEVLHDTPYFPVLEPAGDKVAQMFRSGPDEGSESVRLMYLLAIAASERSIRLMNSYFVPDSLAIQTFVEARERGVDIEIIVPGGRIDAHVTRRASRSLWEPLLESGVRIHEYRPTMMHAKVMIIDGLWVSVGSTNFDSRSFRLNDEANLNVCDAGLAESLERMFARDLARSDQVTLEQWRKRPLGDKLKERAAGLFRGQL